MAEKDRRRNAARTPNPLDQPQSPGRRLRARSRRQGDGFGRAAEGFARFMGTPRFLVWMTLICAVWLGWNSLAPESMQWDERAQNFTLLTLILSLQASYAAPLLLLADNRQADRDKVGLEYDRKEAADNLATTEFITREIASLRLSVQEVATRDFVRSELRDLTEEQQRADRELLKRDLAAEIASDLRAEVHRELLTELRAAGRLLPESAPANTEAAGPTARPTQNRTRENGDPDPR